MTNFLSEGCECLLLVSLYVDRHNCETSTSANAKQIHRHMVNVYDYSSPKYFAVVKCSVELKGKRDSLEDEPRSGRPADAIRQEMNDRVERLVLTNLRIKDCKLARRWVRHQNQ